MAFNRVIMVGRVASDLEMKQSATGKSVVSFSIAVRKDNEHTDFFNAVAREKTAQFICQYFRKGDVIGIEGSLSNRQYEKNGTKVTVTEIVCDRSFFTEGAKKEVGGGNNTPSTYNPYTANPNAPTAFEEIPNDDSLPF